jgi:L-fuculose-phosphate aldolase
MRMFAREQRQQIVDLCIDMSRRGYLAGTGGNVALRIDAEHFAVTPSATDYLSMSAVDVCVVRLSDLACVEGERTPSVETGLHARVLRQRPDVGCSIHTHQPVASACALLDEPPVIDNHAVRAILGLRVQRIGYMPSGTELLAGMLGRALHADSNAYLMRNHGVLCCGADIKAAVNAVEALEKLALRHLTARITARAAADPKRTAAFHRVLAALEQS